MAEKKKVEKLTYEQTVEKLNSKYANVRKEDVYFNTGSLALDIGLGGKGFTGGRIAELIAWEGVGKTTLCLHLVAEAQARGKNVVYVDAEHALDETYARKIGVDWDKLKPTLFQPSCGEEAFDYAKEMISTGEVGLVIFDSTSGMLPKKVMEDPAGSSNMGLHARLFGTELVKINDLAFKHNCLVVFLSQVREKIGVMFGSPETTQAGNALKFWASYRIELRRDLVKEGDSVVGINVRFKTLKNKVFTPYQTGKFPITFGEGIDRLSEIILMAKEDDIISQRTDTFTIKETGEKVKEEDFIKRLNEDYDFGEFIKSKIIETRLSKPIKLEI